jgi:kynurenine 3-monooxygenase
MNQGPRFAVLGAGLGGALLSTYLGRAGYSVEVYERRADPRLQPLERGRSINLALSTRGLDALAGVGLAERALAAAVPMRGRMMHSREGRLSFQPYSADGRQAINSVSRNGLNGMLLDAAEECPGVRLHFGTRCIEVDLDAGIASFELENGERTQVEGAVLVGADGAFSVLRRAMLRLERFDYSQSYLEHGYKELAIPARPGGGHALEPHALHIWPRGAFMMIALPNADGSFTGTLFWPLEGPNSFAELRNAEEVRRCFAATFPDAVPLLPRLADEYYGNPTGTLVTVRCRPWHVGGRAVLIGDAAHAIVPFYGQGANAAFEDCAVLSECLAKHGSDLAGAFAEFEARRRPNTDVLADLAVRNFVEMRDRVASRSFLLVKRLEHGLHRAFPRWFVPLYTMVTFSRTPYAEAVRRDRRQWRAFTWLAALLAAVVFLLLVLILRGS